jgi:ABC-type multidrug transport system ATPase subunit
MLKLVDLTKKYNSGFQLGPINLSVPTGSTVAVFGQNGAGKSTFFSIITGNADRTSGTVFWQDHKISPDAIEMKRKMGYLPQESDLPDWVTPKEILTWNCKLHNLPSESIAEALDLWGAKDWANRPLKACSHGMQKRIGLALATMHNPELLILDEAFNALDISHSKTLENLIRDRKKVGKSTFLSTHTPWIAASLCDAAWILDVGQLSTIDAWPACSTEKRVSLIEKIFFKNESLV